ncbi:MAG TPA: nucleotide exchange factor GrpE, partial [Actinopolymorphaceae bacterium]
ASASGASEQVAGTDSAASSAAGSTGESTGGTTGGTDAATEREAELREQIAERVADLQRLQAEYLNYKRRVERDRQLTREVAVAEVLTELLPVLDDIGRAREHGELEGGFKAVAESLEATLGKIGLERYGEVGDPFDPRIHEALMHGYSDDVTEPSASAVLQPGYRYGERVLRPARVAVAEPTEGLPATEGSAGSDSSAEQHRGEQGSGSAGESASGDSTKS